MQVTTNNLIVGAGLAGCTLARLFEERGYPFRLIGSSALPSATRAAAGIINPVTGRWMTKSWRFDAFAPVAEEFYRRVESDLSIRIFHPLPEIRFCLNADDAKRAGRRSRNPRYGNVLGAYQDPAPESGPFEDNFGSFRIKGAAYVDLPQYLQKLRAHYEAQGSYRDETIDYADLKPSAENWSYRGETYERVIFCEGAAVRDNPWFGDVPLTPAKGETLLCKSDSLSLPNELYHHQKWILPYPDGTFRIGASYDESDLSHEPTPEGAEQLKQSFHDMMRQSHQLFILRHLAGLRPTTPDARPLLGQHLKHLGLYLFNGLGSKGALIAPKLSEDLFDFVFKAQALDPETSIARFSSYAS